MPTITATEKTDRDGACVTWVPRTESILEDAMLMISLYVGKSKEIVELTDKFLHSVSGDKADLYTDIKIDNLEELRKTAKIKKWEKSRLSQ